jgi:hypothetical protein
MNWMVKMREEWIYVPRDFTPSIQNFNSWRIANFLLAPSSHFRDVLPFLQHTKWFPKRQIADDVKRQIIEPVQSIHVVVLSLLHRSSTLVPLLLELLEIVVDICRQSASVISKGIKYQRFTHTVQTAPPTLQKKYVQQSSSSSYVQRDPSY